MRLVQGCQRQRWVTFTVADGWQPLPNCQTQLVTHCLLWPHDGRPLNHPVWLIAGVMHCHQLFGQS